MICPNCGDKLCKKCRHCGNWECQHCVFAPMSVPEGCVCDVNTWGKDKLPAICEAYVGDGTCYCKRCEHDKECHSASQEKE
jgi:hypothetical protein